MSLNFIQPWPEFILSYPLNSNFIHLSLPRVNFIFLSRNCVGTPEMPDDVTEISTNQRGHVWVTLQDVHTVMLWKEDAGLWKNTW